MIDYRYLLLLDNFYADNSLLVCPLSAFDGSRCETSNFISNPPPLVPPPPPY